jgi:hypothetical protein
LRRLSRDVKESKTKWFYYLVFFNVRIILECDLLYFLW